MSVSRPFHVLRTYHFSSSSPSNSKTCIDQRTFWTRIVKTEQTVKTGEEWNASVSRRQRAITGRFVVGTGSCSQSGTIIPGPCPSQCAEPVSHEFTSTDYGALTRMSVPCGPA